MPVPAVIRQKAGMHNGQITRPSGQFRLSNPPNVHVFGRKPMHGEHAKSTKGLKIDLNPALACSEAAVQKAALPVYEIINITHLNKYKNLN